MAITMALAALGAPGTTADVFVAGDHYVAVEEGGTLTLWVEANGYPGLQTRPVLVLGHVAAAPDRLVHL